MNQDLVATCPKSFWEEWIAEGDAAGEPYSGQEWAWYTKHRLARTAQVGARLYIVAHGKLRGFAPITAVVDMGDGEFAICRQGDAMACTIADSIPGFQGLRVRWWNRGAEQPFPDWRRP